MLIYTVKPGDTLAGISRRYGLSPLRIAADNGLSDMSRLVPGQNLLINVDSVRYILDEGQTLFSISQEYGVPLDELIKANPGLNPLNLRPGDTDDTGGAAGKAASDTCERLRLSEHKYEFAQLRAAVPDISQPVQL